MKKFIFISVSILIFCSIISCESMDATYKDFVKDGPIMYLTRLSKDSITVRNGWERVLISFPIVKDGRSTKIALALNQSDTVRYELAKNKRTDILLENMREGSIIFSAWLEDDELNKSLATDFTGTIYGTQYQSYLLNRSIVSKSMQSGNLVIKYSMLLDSTLVASRLTWNKGGEETTKTSYYNKEGQDVLEDFTGDSFIMETLYAPQENVLDKIWSKPVKYTK